MFSRKKETVLLWQGISDANRSRDMQMFAQPSAWAFAQSSGKSSNLSSLANGCHGLRQRYQFRFISSLAQGDKRTLAWLTVNNLISRAFYVIACHKPCGKRSTAIREKFSQNFLNCWQKLCGCARHNGMQEIFFECVPK
jgi:hypothetical protein